MSDSVMIAITIPFLAGGWFGLLWLVTQLTSRVRDLETKMDRMQRSAYWENGNE